MVSFGDVEGTVLPLQTRFLELVRALLHMPVVHTHVGQLCAYRGFE